MPSGVALAARAARYRSRSGLRTVHERLRHGMTNEQRGDGASSRASAQHTLQSRVRSAHESRRQIGGGGSGGAASSVHAPALVGPGSSR